MSVSSLGFFLFFFISLLVYYLLPKGQWIALLVFSAVFFGFSASPATALWLLLTVTVTFFCVRAITAGKKPKLALVIGLTVNLGALALLKYSRFLIDNLNSLLGLLGSGSAIPELRLAAPLGISFYTLQAVSYLLDIYWGMTKTALGPLQTAVYLAYYPLLTSGPILRFSHVEDSMFSRHVFDERTVAFGLQRMLWGVFKKLVISSRAGILVDAIYADPATYSGAYVWLASALFMMQLYTDFSGCMDIVIGASECYGITLPENFRTPFFSRSVQEYWQRWHITLGAWLKDYIMFPVMRSRLWKKMNAAIKKRLGKKAARTLPSFLAMLVVWLLIGLWHGGAWKYILGMGLWFWACIVLAQVLDPVFKRMIVFLRINTDTFSWHLFQSLRVFLLVMIGNMFFRLGSIGEVFSALRSAVSVWNPEVFLDGSLYQLGLSAPDFRIMVLGLGVLLLFSVLEEKGTDVRTRLAAQNLVFRWGILLLLLAAIVLFGSYGPGFDAKSFIYEGF